MIAYYCLLIFFFLVWLVSQVQKNYNKRQLIQYLFGSLALIFILGLRDITVGVDLERYVSYYNEFSLKDVKYLMNINILSNIEPGYLVYLIILKLLNINEFGYILITSIIIVVSYGLFIREYSSNVLFSFFIFVTFGFMAISMSTIRQSLAVSFFLLSIKFYLNKKNLKFILLVIASISFHYSAAIILLLFILHKKLNKTIIIGAILISIAYFLLPSFPTLIGLNVYNLYSDNLFNNSLNPLVVIVNLFLYLFIYISLIRKNSNKNYDEKNNIMFLMATLAVIIYVFSYFFGSILTRLSFYFIPSFLILIPRSLNRFDKTSKSLISLVLIVLFVIYFIITTQKGILSIDNYKMTELSN